jgi:hypothetical protein
MPEGYPLGIGINCDQFVLWFLTASDRKHFIELVNAGYQGLVQNGTMHVRPSAVAFITLNNET